MQTAKTTKSRTGVIAAIVHELLDGEPFVDLADLVEALKGRLARLRIRWTTDEVTDAIRMVGTRRALVVPPAPEAVDVPPAAPPPSRDEAAAVLKNIFAQLQQPAVVRTIPKAAWRDREADADAEAEARQRAAEMGITL